MDFDAVRNELIKSIQNVASPSTVSAKLINQIMSSGYVAETINSMILDPITSKCIPKIKLDGWVDCNLGLWVLYFYNPQKFLDDIIITKNKDLEDELISGYRNGEGGYLLDDIIPTFNTWKIVIFRRRLSLIYVKWINPSDVKTAGYIRMELHFVGPKAYHDALEFTNEMERVKQEMKDIIKKEFVRRIELVTVTDRGYLKRSFTTVPNTIIFEHVEKELQSIINMVEKNQKIKEDFDIDSTIGVLLYGPPGTGKSTISRWLAMTLGRTLILSNGDDIKTAVQYVQDKKSNKDSKFIILVEDIDLIFPDRREKGKSKKEQDENLELTNYFFQVLDGALSSSNLMVIATTNYIERLDPALIRDGRFDFKIEVNGLNYETATKICRKFNVDPEQIHLYQWETPISPATLQAILIKYTIGSNIESSLPIAKPSTTKKKKIEVETIQPAEIN